MIDEALFIQTVQCDFPDLDSQLRNAFITAGGDVVYAEAVISIEETLWQNL